MFRIHPHSAQLLAIFRYARAKTKISYAVLLQSIAA